MLGFMFRIEVETGIWKPEKTELQINKCIQCKIIWDKQPQRT